MTSNPARVPGPVLGLDISGTKLAAGVVTPDGSAHCVIVEPTPKGDWRVAVRHLFDLGRRAVVRAGLDEPVMAVGIGCVGPLDAPAGVLRCPLHLPGWVDVPIGRLAAEEFGVPAVLRNDATAATLAEYRRS